MIDAIATDILRQSISRKILAFVMKLIGYEGQYFHLFAWKAWFYLNFN